MKGRLSDYQYFFTQAVVATFLYCEVALLSYPVKYSALLQPLFVPCRLTPFTLASAISFLRLGCLLVTKLTKKPSPD